MAVLRVMGKTGRTTLLSSTAAPRWALEKRLE